MNENWTDEYERGRQNVIGDLIKTIEFRLKFNDGTLLEPDDKFTYSKEFREGISHTYKQIIGTINIIKTAREDSKLIANPRTPPTHQ